MKKLTLISAFCLLLSAFAFGQTNAVKMSALPLANTPLGGTELMPLNQVISGTNSTRLATVDQVNAKSTAAINSYSNSLNAAVAALAGTVTTTSNSLALRIGTNNATLTSTSNALQTQITANAGAIVSSNAAVIAALTATNNALLSALQGTNAALSASIAAMAAGQGNVLTNGGTARFASVTATNLTTPSVNVGTIAFSGYPCITNLNFAAGSLQTVRLIPTSGGMTINFAPTNFVDGQTVTLLVKPPSITTSVNSVASVPGATMLGVGTGLTVYSSGGGALLNWMVIGTNIIYSGGTL